MDQIPDPASSATAWERMFMECDQQGRVLWMNKRAQARLGPLDSLLSALPAAQLPEASKLLKPHAPEQGRRLVSSLQPTDKPARVPVQLVRLLTLEDRVVLSAEIRARASDTPRQQDPLRTLLRMQSNATRNYFRLLRAERLLASRSQSSKSTGAIISEALEIERTRIARELHSGVGQALAGIKINLDLIEAEMSEPPEAVRKSIWRIHALTEEALGEIRSVSQRLHPPDWQRLDLPKAIEWLWNTSGIPEKFHATLELHPVESDVPDAVRFAIYRAAQEGLANVLRHAGAVEMKLELGERDDQIYLTLEDNGSGFNAEELLRGAPTPAMRGIGLRAMRDEVIGLGGRFDLFSGSRGTKLQITIPLTENR